MSESGLRPSEGPKIKYVIEYGVRGIATLYSVVDTNFGGAAKNYICEGTEAFCEDVIERLKNKEVC